MIWDFTATDFMRQGRGDYTSKLCIGRRNTSRGLRIQNQNKNAKYAIALTCQILQYCVMLTLLLNRNVS